MILDDLVAGHPRLRQLFGDPHIVKLPFRVCTFVKKGDYNAILWGTDRIPRGMMPHSLLHLKGKECHILGAEWINPPYPKIILVGNGPELACAYVKSWRPRADETLRTNVIETPLGQVATGEAVRWVCQALLVGIADGGLNINLFTFSLGKGVGLGGPEDTICRWANRRYPDSAKTVSLQMDEDAPIPDISDEEALAAIRKWTHGSRVIAEAILGRQMLDHEYQEIVSREWANPTSLARSIQEMAQTVVTAFGLLSCKNVEQELIVPPHLRAARRRGDLPPYRYHILKVRPFATKRKPGERQGKSGPPVAIHWVRGHVKHYTAERPLLGKFTGAWWWQPHLAGRAYDRVVDKDYEIVP